eukprot:41234_1
MNDIEWEIFYWPAKNRGNHLVLLLEEANVPYKLINDPKKVVQYIRSNNFDRVMHSRDRKIKLDNDGIYYQPMAPPYLIHYPKNSDEKIILCQTEHCVGYIAEKIGLKPDLIEDHYRAQMIVGHVNELQREIRTLRLTAKSKQEVIEFINGRFEVWMSILEKPLKIYKQQKFYFGDKISQADLCVFNVMNGIYEVFDEKGFNAIVKSKHPVLVRHYERILNRPRVKRLMDRQQKQNISWFPSAFLGFVWDWKLIKSVINDMHISYNRSKL